MSGNALIPWPQHQNTNTALQMSDDTNFTYGFFYSQSITFAWKFEFYLDSIGTGGHVEWVMTSVPCDRGVENIRKIHVPLSLSLFAWPANNMPARLKPCQMRLKIVNTVKRTLLLLGALWWNSNALCQCVTGACKSLRARREQCAVHRILHMAGQKHLHLLLKNWKANNAVYSVS